MKKLLFFSILLFSIVSCKKATQDNDTENQEVAESIQVTPETFVVADVGKTFNFVVQDVGTNKFRHDKNLISLDKQPAVTMNRNTIYSLGVFNAPKGTKIYLPETKDNRYLSAMILQNDHYIDQVFYSPGEHEIISQTDFVGIVVRYQVQENDADDLDYVHSLQEQVKVTFPEGVTPAEYVYPNWDQSSLDSLRMVYQKEAATLKSFNGTSGAHGTLDPHLQRLGVSVALGLLPPQDAVYMYRDYGLNGSDCYEATYKKPGYVGNGFFSFTMYGSDKYLKSINSSIVDKNIVYDKNGDFTVHYKGTNCAHEGKDNVLETAGDNWYLALRVYRPVQSIIDGNYDIPVPVVSN